MSELKNLILKYETSGPRYTSYPTAPHFSENADKLALMQKAVENNAPKSLYIHIPFCKTLCFFCGCSSSVCTDEKRADAYLRLLERELFLWENAGLKKSPLTQIHFGGGTPNFLNPKQILELNSIIKKFFDMEKDCEYSVELDPRTLDEAKIESFAKIGVNRASIGVQDTNAKIQKIINRIQPQALNLSVAELLRKHGVNKINLDLIYGLPEQNAESFKQTITDALALNPNRIALFSYAHLPWLKSAQKSMEKYHIPQGLEKISIFEEALNSFEAKGFEYIGLDHFALPNDELIKARQNKTLQRNFQGYSTRAGADSFGLGLTSISQTKDSYRQNKKTYLDYESAINAGVIPIERGIILNSEDLMRREIIMDLMCFLEIDFQKFEEKYSVNFKEYFASAFENLNKMQDDKLLILSANKLELTKLGRLFLRNIAMLFDGHLEGGNQKYSKTV